MLSSEFSQEMGALIRRLEARVRNEPGLMDERPGPQTFVDTDHIERAIVTLVALYLRLRQ